MKTGKNSKSFILKWNPTASPVNLDDWDFWVKKQCFLEVNWTVDEHEKVDVGDKWYMLRVGEGVTGIIGHGSFSSNPQKGEDWSGQGKVAYYSDLHIQHLVPHSEPIIPTDILEKQIPNINWRDGRSGILLSKEDEEALEELMHQYYKTNPVDRLNHEISIEPGIEKDIIGWENLRDLFKEKLVEEDYIYSNKVFHGMVTLKTGHVYSDSCFTFTILIQGCVIMLVTCRKLQRIKTEIHGDEGYESYCKIWHDGYYFHVNINKVEVICEDLEFGATAKYDKNYIAVTI